MGPRLLKEARGLLPAWLATLFVVFVPLALLRLLPFPRGTSVAAGLGLLHTLGLALGPLVLSSTAFGREFEDGTFGLLLSQPVSRWRLWWEKTGLLALALATVYGAFLLAWLLGGGRVLPVRVVTGIILIAFGGGLLCSLLVRQTVGAVCLGSVVPFFLSVIVVRVALAVARHSHGSGLPSTALAQLWSWGAAVWATLSYAAAALLFMRKEDRAAAAGLGVLGLRLRASRRAGGRVRPWRALVWKELHLQQWGLYLGLALPVLSLIAIPLAPSQAERASTAFIAVRVAMVLLTLGVPALIGTTAVADERRTGTLAWQRTLPVPHWQQFGVKLAVAWGLALLCAPWVPLPTGEGGEALVAAVSAIVLVAVFASSLSRHVVEAMALSLALFLALLVATDGGRWFWSLVDEARWLPLLATLVAAAGVLVVLAGWNAREVTAGRRRQWANVAVILAAVVLARLFR